MPPATDFDLTMMRRAISLAMRGRGYVEPNPMVGCVIVKDGRVIGEGWHQKYGQPHAEPNAIANCTESPAGATAYVTLEPCCHTNKKTPPCVPAVIAAGIKRVVVGCPDPNPEVNGHGMEMLRQGHVEVIAPVLEDEAKQLIAPFWKRVNLRRPYVTLKWAESADGKVAGPGGTRVQISNEASMRQVHELRARCDAVMIGGGTLRMDDPLLTARGIGEVRQPKAMLIGGMGKPLLASRLFRQRRDELVLFGRTAASGNPGVVRNRLRMLLLVERQPISQDELASMAIHEVGADPRGGLSLRDVLRVAGEEYRMTHVLVEAGPRLARSFLQWGLVDRAWVFKATKTIEDESAPGAPAVPSHYFKSGEVDLVGDVLTEYLNPASEAFFAPVESADLVRVRGDG